MAFKIVSYWKRTASSLYHPSQRLIKQNWKAARIFESRLFWGFVFCILALSVPTVYLSGTQTWSITVPIWSQWNRKKMLIFPRVLLYAILTHSGPKHAFSGSSESFVWENLKPHPGHHPDAIILLSSWVLKTTFQATANHPGVILLRFAAVVSSWSHPVMSIMKKVIFGKFWVFHVEGSIILVE